MQNIVKLQAGSEDELLYLYTQNPHCQIPCDKCFSKSALVLSLSREKFFCINCSKDVMLEHNVSIGRLVTATVNFQVLKWDANRTITDVLGELETVMNGLQIMRERIIAVGQDLVNNSLNSLNESLNQRIKGLPSLPPSKQRACLLAILKQRQDFDRYNSKRLAQIRNRSSCLLAQQLTLLLSSYRSPFLPKGSRQSSLLNIPEKISSVQVCEYGSRLCVGGHKVLGLLDLDSLTFTYISTEFVVDGMVLQANSIVFLCNQAKDFFQLSLINLQIKPYFSVPNKRFEQARRMTLNERGELFFEDKQKRQLVKVNTQGQTSIVVHPNKQSFQMCVQAGTTQVLLDSTIGRVILLNSLNGQYRRIERCATVPFKNLSCLKLWYQKGNIVAADSGNQRFVIMQMTAELHVEQLAKDSRIDAIDFSVGRRAIYSVHSNRQSIFQTLLL